MLDIQSLRPDVILLLDSFFHVVIWHGDMIHSWKEQGYDQSPEYQNFKELLEVDIMTLVYYILYNAEHKDH